LLFLLLYVIIQISDLENLYKDRSETNEKYTITHIGFGNILCRYVKYLRIYVLYKENNDVTNFRRNERVF